MTKHVFVFLATFAVGAVVSLTVRAARLDIHKEKPAPTAHEHHSATTPTATAPNTADPVNTVCAICGMEVDPDIPTADYQGHKIGFGCKACPPKFRANPDKYGPAALRNEVLD